MGRCVRPWDHIQRSTSGPAGSRTRGRVASARWLYPGDPGRQKRREKGRRFSPLIHKVDATSTAVCSDLICPASPTHKYFTNTSHTRNLAERPPTPGCHTPSLIFFSPTTPALSDSGLFFFLPTSYLPSAALYLALFHLLRVLKLLTEDKMLRAVVPHFVLCN